MEWFSWDCGWYNSIMDVTFYGHPRASGVRVSLRGVDDESVPLALDVVVRRLFGDIETVKFNLSGDLLLPLKDHHGNLEVEFSRQCSPPMVTCVPAEGLAELLPTFRQ